MTVPSEDHTPDPIPMTAPEVKHATVLPERFPPVPALRTPPMDAFSAAVRTTAGLRTELIVQAQQGPDIGAYERVLATAAGANRVIGPPLSTPELLHWAHAAMAFRRAAPQEDAWQEALPTRLSATDPVWKRPLLNSPHPYALNDPLWARLISGALLALGYPRSDRVQKELEKFRARQQKALGPAFFHLPLQLRPHQSRLLPMLERNAQVRHVRPTRLDLVGGHPLTGTLGNTPALVLFSHGDQPDLLFTVVDWPLTGPAARISVAETVPDLKARLARSAGDDLSLYGALGAYVPRQDVHDLLNTAPPDVQVASEQSDHA